MASVELEVEGVAVVLSQVSEAAELLPWHGQESWSGGLSLASSLGADPTMLITRLHEHPLTFRNKPAYARRTSTATWGSGWSGHGGGRAVLWGCLRPSPTNTTINWFLSQEATLGRPDQNRVRIWAGQCPRDVLNMLTPLQPLLPRCPSSSPIPTHSWAHRDPHSSSISPESPCPHRSGAWPPPPGCEGTISHRAHPPIHPPTTSCTRWQHVAAPHHHHPAGHEDHLVQKHHRSLLWNQSSSQRTFF